MPRTAVSLETLLTRYVVDADGCWLWTGNIGQHGYGRAWRRIDGRKRLLYAHRLSYEHHVGPIPDGLELDHLCRKRACIRPACLEPVTHAVNVARGEAPAGVRARAAKCPAGHPRTAEHFYIRPDGTGGHCRTCVNARRREAHRRERLTLAGTRA